jgi:hypothetical protein
LTARRFSTARACATASWCAKRVRETVETEADADAEMGALLEALTR